MCEVALAPFLDAETVLTAWGGAAPGESSQCHGGLRSILCIVDLALLLGLPGVAQ